jgi:hypothetical protein
MNDKPNNIEVLPDQSPVPPKMVKATPTSPVFAMFDLVELEGKQVITGSIGFVDQFGMERMAKTGTDKGVLNLGNHILAIYAGQVDIAEPDEETKAKLAKNLEADAAKAKENIINAYRSTNEKAAEPQA